jgi:N-acetylated-alpha-linked acidic dipeptidase
VKYQEAVAAGGANPGAVNAANQVLMSAERALTRQDGLPGRKWFRHQLYAPGLYTGYSAKTLPGVREAAELGKFEEARQQVGVLAETIRAFTAVVERATASLR